MFFKNERIEVLRIYQAWLTLRANLGFHVLLKRKNRSLTYLLSFTYPTSHKTVFFAISSFYSVI